jgi:hypothetical protein
MDKKKEKVVGYLQCCILSMVILYNMVSASDYTTYAGDKFVYIHYGELDNVFIDTVHVLSITVKDDVLHVRVVGSKIPLIIKHPDKLEVVCPKN